jgi:hypothetical protein
MRLDALPPPEGPRPVPLFLVHKSEGKSLFGDCESARCPSAPPAHTMCLNARRRHFLRPKAAGRDQYFQVIKRVPTLRVYA